MSSFKGVTVVSISLNSSKNTVEVFGKRIRSTEQPDSPLQA